MVDKARPATNEGSSDHRSSYKDDKKHGEKPTEGERPNPCLPEDVSDDCHCVHAPGPRSTPRKPKRPKPRAQECCDQLIEILAAIPDLKLPKPYKPKQKPPRKVQAMCNALGIRDAILPTMEVLWSRYRAGESGRNEFEEKVRAVFAKLDGKQQNALEVAFEGYRKLRRGGKGECLFNDCLADVAREGPIERKWFAELLLAEGLKLAGQIVFSGSGGVMGPGQVRLWDNKVFRGPNGSGTTIYQGPWPWLTAICPDVSSYEEFGNLESFRPAPGSSHVWQNYQYDQTCNFTPDSSGTIQAVCERSHPPPPAPGSLFANNCPGGEAYTYGNDCLRIPAQRAGGSIKLRGFNFITPTVKVRMTLTTNSAVTKEEECIVWGDRETPLKDDKDHFIVDERVHDWVDFPIPSENPIQGGAPLPAGIYEVVVTVANVTNAIYDGSTPAVLTTNKLLLRIEPDANVKYLLWSERGRCNRETPGWGDDEIWWDAFVGHIVPNEVPVPSSGSSGLQIKSIERRSFPRQPWEDMDDGESAGSFSQDIFGPASFELYGVAVFAIVGFEVDSEAAARDQLQGFWNAWGEALSDVVGVAVGGEGVVTGLASLAVKAGIIAAKLAFTIAIVALVVIAAITLIATAFWAAWAPADLIALDIFHRDALSAWDATDPDKPLPLDAQRRFQDADDSDNLVSVTERALPKLHKSGDAAATWIQENQYDTPEDGEDASYTLEFRLARS
jgi:hypothetical protein